VVPVEAGVAAWARVEMVVMARLGEVLARCGPGAMVAVDVPIGLAAVGARACDRLVRAELVRLGGSGSSVFAAPARGAVGARSQAEATHLSRAAGGPGVSVQVFNIFAKIREADEVMTPPLQARVFETHPETTLAALAKRHGAAALGRKRTTEGRTARVGLLRQAGVTRAADLMAQAVGMSTRSVVAAPDDALDAIASALVALARAGVQAGGRDPARVWGDGAVDARGLAMAIWTL
jgi:predicted RNase H-like nuclease